VSKPLVYVADDEASVLDALSALLARKLDFRVRTFGSVADTLEALGEERPDVLLTDVSFDGVEAGLRILRAARERWPELPVILMSAVASREAAIQAVNERAFHFLEKPFRNEDVLSVLRAAVASASAREEARREAVAPVRPSRRHNHAGGRAASDRAELGRALQGESPAFRETLALVGQAARSDVTVLLEGESGVGKGVFAAHLHARSSRGAGPFLSVNCGALTETLLESQLFGHVRGAFTGADRDQPGLVRAAQGGTLFLDELSELSPATQVKLLRVLQEREVIPVGGVETHSVDVRFVAASNRDLRALVSHGNFREDLFWRLNVMPIRVPPLRERPGDIPLLAAHALAKIRARDPSVRARAIHPDAMERLSRHAWPGNVRELENAIERAAVVSGEVLGEADLPAEVGRSSPGGTPRFPVLEEATPTLEAVERAYAAWVLARCEGDLARAAEALGVPTRVLSSILGTFEA
jgi:DNA-binding NtrC family response regulator